MVSMLFLTDLWREDRLKTFSDAWDGNPALEFKLKGRLYNGRTLAGRPCSS